MKERLWVLRVVGVMVMMAGCREAVPVEPIRAPAGAVVPSEVIVAEGDWPRWRGSQQDGISTAQGVPTTWSETQHVRWRTDVPGRGHSSPIVVQDRIFLTTAVTDQEQRWILGYDRATGKELWRTLVHQGGLMPSHRKNSHASATLAWDGERLLAVFIHANALWLTAVSHKGEILWQKEAGPFRSEHGYGSSPALYQSLVIVCGDNAGSSFLAALDRETGQIVWRTTRERPGRHGNYATPIVQEVAGKPQLLLHGHGKLTSYDPATGELIWSCEGPSEVAACTIACSDDVVFASGGYPEKEILAVKADGRGDVSGTHVIWRASKGVTYVPSPVYHDGHLYLVNDQGIASCLAADSGRVAWQERLGGDFSASPVLVDGSFFASNETGTTYVFAAAPEFRLIAENKLGEGYFASPAISGEQIFLRTTNQLCCIGEK